MSSLFICIYYSTEISNKNAKLICFPHDVCGHFWKDYSIKIQLKFWIFKFTHTFIMI
jgi:hypothetical protein